MVIGAGFGRTGTTSLKAALEKLGFGPCYHMTEVFAHPKHEAVWSAAGRGEPADLEAVLEGYEATLDWPAWTGRPAPFTRSSWSGIPRPRCS